MSPNELAGGVGSRLCLLSERRAKPAVPFGGKYRIIDFTLSNCLNSGLRKIAVLIQYKSHSLDKHIRSGWNILNAELGEYIASVPPQQRISEDWYRGTADAVAAAESFAAGARALGHAVLHGDREAGHGSSGVPERAKHGG